MSEETKATSDEDIGIPCIDEFRRAHFKIAGRNFVFRLPDGVDKAAIEKQVPALNVKVDSVDDAIDKLADILENDPEALRLLMERLDQVLLRCSIKPKLVNKDEFNEETEYPLRSLNVNERTQTAVLLWGFAGVTADASVEIIPLQKTGTS